MAVNIVIFIAALINQNKIVDNLGLAPVLFTHKPWTIVTNMFVQVEFWHLFGNMIALFFFGRIIYQMVGTGRILLLYFIGGIVGNIIYILFGPDYSVAIGASGAIYALAGALVVIVPRLPVRLYFVIPIPLWVFVIIFLGLLSVPPFTSATIAWQAHLGGLAVGLIAGYFFRKRIRLNFYR